jgi:hypothetical protein
MYRLARLLHTQGRYNEAEPLLRDCLGVRDKKQPENWRRYSTMSLLGATLAGQAKAAQATDAQNAETLFAEAEPLLVEGYEGMQQREATIAARHKEKLSTGLQRVTELYDAWGKPEQESEWKKKMETNSAPEIPPEQTESPEEESQ